MTIYGSGLLPAAGKLPAIPIYLLYGLMISASQPMNRQTLPRQREAGLSGLPQPPISSLIPIRIVFLPSP